MEKELNEALQIAGIGIIIGLLFGFLPVIFGHSQPDLNTSYASDLNIVLTGCTGSTETVKHYGLNAPKMESRCLDG